MLLPGQSELIEITQALIIYKNLVFPCICKTMVCDELISGDESHIR